MWGSVKPAPLFGGDIFDPTGPLGPALEPEASPMAAAVAKKPRQGISWLGVLADALSGAAGQAPLYTQGRLREQQSLAQQALAESQRQRQNEDARANFTFEQDYRAAHPTPREPGEFERALEAGGTRPGTSEWQAAMRRRSENLLNPMTAIDVQQPDGSTVRQFIRPPAPTATPAPPQPGEVRGGHRFRGGDPANPASWEPVESGAATNLRNWNGGASPSNGSGGFR